MHVSAFTVSDFLVCAIQWQQGNIAIDFEGAIDIFGVVEFRFLAE